MHRAIAEAVAAAQSVERVQKIPTPICLVHEFSDHAIRLELRVWIDDPMNGVANVKSACLLAVWDRFKEAGIVFPFPRREIRILKDGDETGPTVQF